MLKQSPVFLLIVSASKVNCFFQILSLIFPAALSISPLLSPVLDMLTQVLCGAVSELPGLGCHTWEASHRSCLWSPCVTKALPHKCDIEVRFQEIWGRKRPCFIPCYFEIVHSNFLQPSLSPVTEACTYHIVVCTAF